MTTVARRYTPLAWNNLTHDPRRLATAVAGVAFAVVLMFLELGFWGALLESTVQLPRRLDADVVMTGAAHYSLVSGERFDIQRLQQARQVPGVRWARPIYIESTGSFLKVGERPSLAIRAIAVDERESPLKTPTPEELRANLSAPSTAMWDVDSRGSYRLPGLGESPKDVAARLNDQDIELTAPFRLGIDFSTDGNLLLSTRTFAAAFPHRGLDPLRMVDLGAIAIEPGADPREVVSALNAVLSADARAWTRDDLIAREKAFWQTNAPVGYIFAVGAIMGFVVGIVICYQIIYSDINDHMKEFATLKAIGYRPVFFRDLVFRQSLYLAALGYVPGCAIALLSYACLRSVTGLTVEFDPWRAAFVFVATAVMCAISGRLAVGKLLSSDPAELF